MRTKGKQNMMKRIITFPIRALVKARDSYVKGMVSFGEKGLYGGFTGGASSSRSAKLPKSYTISSSNSSYESEDMRDLIRAASIRRLGSQLTDELSSQPAPAPATVVVPRSCSVGMAKIDENSPCEFGEEAGVLGVIRAKVVYPRSKSYAVAKRSMIYA